MHSDQGRHSGPTIHNADQPRGPWGGGGDNGGGPRNPWSVPPGGRKGPAKPTALDEFLRKARGGGGGPSGLPNPAPRALWLIGIAVLLVAWVLFTSIHPIGQGQRGVVTRLGGYAGTLDPGIQLTLPSPLASVTKVDVQSVREETFPESGAENLMLTRDQNIIDLAYSVRWTISSAEDYVFQIADPRATVRAVAESAMREVVASVTLDQAIGPGRDFIAAQVQDRMQRVLDEYRSGIRIQGVGIRQADPPQAVNDAFKDVTAAQQDAQAARNNAQAYAQRKTALAQGEAAAFDAYYAQYKLAPDVTRRRMYYETMEDVLSRTDKTVVEPRGVTPYLPLDRARRLPEPAETATPQGGAGQ
jgi:modulator of FtsH protease HflK